MREGEMQIISSIISVLSALIALVALCFNVIEGRRNRYRREIETFDLAIHHAEQLIDQWLLAYAYFSAKLMPYWNKNKEKERPNLNDDIALHGPLEQIRQLRLMIAIAFPDNLPGRLAKVKSVSTEWKKFVADREQLNEKLYDLENSVFVQYLCLVPDNSPADYSSFLRLVNSESHGRLNKLAESIYKEHDEIDRKNIPYIAERLTIRLNSQLPDLLSTLNKSLAQLRNAI